MSTPAPATPKPSCVHNVAMPTPEQLPDDVATLKRMIIELLATVQEERRDKEALRHRVTLLLQRLYGRRTERVHPEQGWLFPEENSAPGTDPAATTARTTAENQAEPASRPRRRGKPHGRGRLPEDLPRRPLHHELTEAERVCVCGQLRIDIGTDVSEQVDWQPAALFVWQHLVHKYVCPACAQRATEATTSTPTPAPEGHAAAGTLAPARGPVVLAAPKPPPPLTKGLPGAGLLAYVIVSKYYDHLPLHRLEHILGRQGLPIHRSTLCDWMAASAQALRPLYDLMVSEVLRSAWLHTDDTPVKNQGHAPGTTALSRLWIYWGDRTHPYNVFDFTINRKRDGPQKFLTTFQGYLQADAFSGYDALYLPPPRAQVAPIIEVACNAHARRKFYEARGSDAWRAHQALAYYRQLYALEAGASDAGLDDASRLQMRQDLAVPILQEFHRWLVAQRSDVLPKSPIAEAIGYALNNWTALQRYTEAGFLAIDNNVAEREMKRIAIGRKNWLFVGSDQGGQTAAVLFSFTSTCQRLGVEAWAYLQDVLARLPTTPAGRLDVLLPDRWQAARQAMRANPLPQATATTGSPDTSDFYC